MSRPITIDPSNVPLPSPVTSLLVAYLMLVHFQAPEWMYWLLYGVGAFAVYGWYLHRKNSVRVDLFSEAKRQEVE